MPAFEAKDLAVTVQRLVGVDGPRWDFERLTVESKDVIVVVVDPPTGGIATCRADGEGLTDGGIHHVRAELAEPGGPRAVDDRGADRPSNSADGSGRRRRTAIVRESTLALQLDESELTRWIEQEAGAASEQGRPPDAQPRTGTLQSARGTRRSREEFLAEVGERGQDSALEAPDSRRPSPLLAA